MVSPIADFWYVTRSKRKYMKPSAYSDKDLHEFVRFDTSNLHLQQNQEEPQRRLKSKVILDISNHQDDAIVNHFCQFARIVLKALGTSVNRLVVVRMQR